MAFKKEAKISSTRPCLRERRHLNTFKTMLNPGAFVIGMHKVCNSGRGQSRDQTADAGLFRAHQWT
jgi:hypothetical protein